MGSMFGWECAKCGASERFSCGYGMMAMRDADVVRRAREGDYGRAMATLFKDGVPEGWYLIRSRVYYRCPECDVTVEGARLLVDDGSDGELAYLVAPGPCPSCGLVPDLEDLMARPI
jgi:rubrerythrin